MGDKMDGACGTYVGDKRRIHGLVVKPEGRRSLVKTQAQVIILRRIFRKSDVGTWTGSNWLRIGTRGGQLLMR
jgi:hypothetical protein